MSLLCLVIEDTLNEGETGILFVGAYHDVDSKLSGEIQVIEVKDKRRICDYQKKFLYRERNRGEIEEVARYLVSPVEVV